MQIHKVLLVVCLFAYERRELGKVEMVEERNGGRVMIVKG